MDAALIGSNNPTFENDYFASDNMAWVRPNKFVNYGELIRTNNYDGLDHLEEKRRYRPGSMKRRYRPGSLKRRYLPSSLNDDDLMMNSSELHLTVYHTALIITIRPIWARA